MGPSRRGASRQRGPTPATKNTHVTCANLLRLRWGGASKPTRSRSREEGLSNSSCSISGTRTATHWVTPWAPRHGQYSPALFACGQCLDGDLLGRRRCLSLLWRRRVLQRRQDDRPLHRRRPLLSHRRGFVLRGWRRLHVRWRCHRGHLFDRRRFSHHRPLQTRCLMVQFQEVVHRGIGQAFGPGLGCLGPFCACRCPSWRSVTGFGHW